jgi:polysaccharide biosynthesis transport protein
VTSYADQRVQIISQRVMTTKNLLEIIERYDLYPHRRKRDTREALIARMRKDIRVDMISASVIDPRSGTPREATIAFTVSYTSRSPAQAVRVANELTTLYLNENVTERTRLAQDASTFLEEEAKRLSARIDELEERLAQFKAKNADSLPEMSMLNIQMLDRTEQDLRQQQARLVSLNEQRVYLESQLAQVKPYAVLMSDTGERIQSPSDRLKSLRSRLASARGLYSADHPDVVRMQAEIAGLEAEPGTRTDSAANDIARRLEDARTRRAQAREKYAAEHPDVQRAEREVIALEAELAVENARPASAEELPHAPDNPVYVQLQTQLSANGNERRALESQIAELRAQAAGYQRKISLSPQTEKEYRELGRDYQNSQAKYQEIRAKQMEAQVSQNLEAGRKGERFTLIEPPLPPEEPVSPNRAAIWIAGVLLSLALAAGMAALRETLDATVRGRKDIVSLLSEAPLALIPRIATTRDVQMARQRARYALGTAAVLAIAAVCAVHFMYRPLDVLWYVVLRKIGL